MTTDRTLREALYDTLNDVLVDAHGVPDDERRRWATRLANAVRAALQPASAPVDEDLWRFISNVETACEDNGTRSVLFEDLRAMARDWSRDRERGWHAGHGRQDAEPRSVLALQPASAPIKRDGLFDAADGVPGKPASAPADPETCVYECPYNRDGHEAGMAGHSFEPASAPAAERLRGAGLVLQLIEAAQAWSIAHHHANFRLYGPPADEALHRAVNAYLRAAQLEQWTKERPPEVAAPHAAVDALEGGRE